MSGIRATASATSTPTTIRWWKPARMCLLDGDREVAPGIRMRRVPGHNRDMMIVTARVGRRDLLLLLGPRSHRRPRAADLGGGFRSVSARNHRQQDSPAEPGACGTGGFAVSDTTPISLSRASQPVQRPLRDRRRNSLRPVGRKIEYGKPAGIPQRAVHRLLRPGEPAGHGSGARRRCAANSGANTNCASAASRIRTGDMLMSVNPSNTRRSRRRASQGHARNWPTAPWKRPMRFFPEWSRTPAAGTASACCSTPARILRERKLEFDAWLVFEAGKTWPEAEAEVSEAIDFCEYYAREMAAPGRPAAGGAAARRARRDASTCRWAWAS